MIEFWPDYGSGPLWRNGAAANPGDLGISPTLADRLSAWNAEYDEAKIPIDGEGDTAWLAEGAGLLREVRGAVRPEFAVVVTEPWWNEEPTA